MRLLFIVDQKEPETQNTARIDAEPFCNQGGVAAISLRRSESRSYAGVRESRTKPWFRDFQKRTTRLELGPSTVGDDVGLVLFVGGFEPAITFRFVGGGCYDVWTRRTHAVCGAVEQSCAVAEP